MPLQPPSSVSETCPGCLAASCWPENLQRGSFVSTSVPSSWFQSLFMFHYLFHPREHKLLGCSEHGCLARLQELSHACRTDFLHAKHKILLFSQLSSLPLAQEKGILGYLPTALSSHWKRGPKSSSDTRQPHGLVSWVCKEAPPLQVKNLELKKTRRFTHQHFARSRKCQT